MNGAIFYSSKYGSTKQYAYWIGEATDLPVFDTQYFHVDPAEFDFLILGSPIIYYRLSIRKWVRNHLQKIKDKPIIFFSVSGTGAGDKLNHWIAKSLPMDFISQMYHVALKGRQIPEELTLYDRIMLKVGAIFNTDPIARKQELRGFDFMDKSSIEPIVRQIQQFSKEAMLVDGKG